jgi:thiosulfate/3-mercaptopyruvate sulfurtransferase
MVRFYTRLIPVLAIVTGLASAAWAQQPSYKGYARGSALITAKELKQLIDSKDPKLVILAAENDVEYRLGHIPLSHQVDRPAYEAPAQTQGGVTGNLIDAPGFNKLAQQLGITKDSKIIVYDTKYDATRLWWAFLYYGKGDVRVLDGGIKAWKDSGYETAILAPDAAKPGTFAARISSPRLRVDTPEILALSSGKGQLWDNRDRKEYCGEELKKGAYRKGHIPWGQHSDWTIFKKKENAAEWISASESQGVLKKLGADPKKDQYFFCQSGVRSTQAMFTFYLLGWSLEKLHNYDSSWIGWSKDPSLPIETGCNVNPAVASAH